MMGHCDCGSYAINPALHGREPGKNLNLCDVCYWREEVKHLTAELASETKWAHDYQREAEALRTQLALLGKPAPDVQADHITAAEESA